MTPHPDTAGACLAACAAAGLTVPALIRRIPEPVDADPAEADEPPGPTYAEVAARPGLAWRCAVAAGVAGAVVGLVTGWARPLLLLVPLVPVAVALGVVDWHTRLLPRLVVLPATGVAVVLGSVLALVTGSYQDLLRAGVGLVATRSLFWVLWRVHSAGMGFGDVRLAALLGFVLGHLGWAQLVVGVYAGFLVFGLPALARVLLRRDRRLLKAALPFGPAMLAGALVGVALGPVVAPGLGAP